MTALRPACLHLTPMFFRRFSYPPEFVERAREICAACPLFAACQERSLRLGSDDDQDGIFAGWAPHQRWQIRRYFGGVAPDWRRGDTSLPLSRIHIRSVSAHERSALDEGVPAVVDAYLIDHATPAERSEIVMRYHEWLTGIGYGCNSDEAADRADSMSRRVRFSKRQEKARA